MANSTPAFHQTRSHVVAALDRVQKLEVELAEARQDLSAKFATHAAHFTNQTRLARAMETTPPYLHDVVNGKRNANPKIVNALLGVKSSEI